MGTFDGSLALVHGSVKRATISMTDGSNTMASQAAEPSAQIWPNKVRHQFNISCDDGGKVNLFISHRPPSG